MCGISGWFDTVSERPPDRALGQAMTDAIRHRGPDGEGHHYAPGIALGHRRLAIIDLATGDQPMFDPTGMFHSSVTAHTNRTRKNVPTIWSISGPKTLWKYGAGKVANVL